MTELSLGSRLISMDIIIISALAIACILTAIEGLFRPLGKLRGLLGLALGVLVCLNQGAELKLLGVYTLAATFLGLSLSLLVEQSFVGINERELRGLPSRIDKR